MAKLSLKQLGKKAAEQEWQVGPQPGFWSWQERLSAEEWAEARNSYDKRTAELESTKASELAGNDEEPVPDEEREVEMDASEYDTV